MDEDELTGLIARAKAGDEEAARELQRLEHDIRMIVRVRLPRALRTQFDSMDFVQAVWQSFLTGEDRHDRHFRDSAQLRGYLIGMARNKILEAQRKSKSKKYEIDREEPLYVRRGERDVPREVAAHDPTPSQDVIARDEMEHLVAGRNPKEARVLELRLQGYSFDEIAAQTGLNERTVRRMMESLRQILDDREQP
jgi:RNA polymerase sigma-70 factor (ECF subfamily)